MADWPLSGDGQLHATYGNNPATTFSAISLTPSTISTYSPWVELTTSAGIAFHANGFLYTAGHNDSLVQAGIDIGIGAPGSQVTLVQRLYTNRRGALDYGGDHMYMPLSLPAGTRVWARHTSDSASANELEHEIKIIGSGFRPSPVLGRCTTYNMLGSVLYGDAGNGTLPRPDAICDPGFNTGVFSPWKDITSIAASPVTLQHPISMAAFVFVQDIADAGGSTTRWTANIGVGAVENVSVQTLIGAIPFQQHIDHDRFSQPWFGPVPLSLPAGARVQAQVQCLATTAGRRNVGVLMYAFS